MGREKIEKTTLFDLRWLTKKYYKKKGYIPLDISKWPPFNRSDSIKRKLGTNNKKSNTLFLKDQKGSPCAIVIIKDWKRVVGVNQGYQVERLKKILKNENVDITRLKFILVSRRGFSESTKRFAEKQGIALKAEADMTYEYPILGDLVREQRMRSVEVENKESEEKGYLSEDELDILSPHRKKNETEDFSKRENK